MEMLKIASANGKPVHFSVFVENKWFYASISQKEIDDAAKDKKEAVLEVPDISFFRHKIKIGEIKVVE